MILIYIFGLVFVKYRGCCSIHFCKYSDLAKVTLVPTRDRGPKGDENGSDQNGVELSQPVVQLKACNCNWKPISVDMGMLVSLNHRVYLNQIVSNICKFVKV